MTTLLCTFQQVLLFEFPVLTESCAVPAELRAKRRRYFQYQHELIVAETQPAVPAQSPAAGPRSNQIPVALLLQGQTAPVRRTDARHLTHVPCPALSDCFCVVSGTTSRPRTRSSTTPPEVESYVCAQTFLLWILFSSNSSSTVSRCLQVYEILRRTVCVRTCQTIGENPALCACVCACVCILPRISFTPFKGIQGCQWDIKQVVVPHGSRASVSSVCHLSQE